MAGLYIHVPFCASRCIYCDFYSTTGRNRSLFVERILDELKTYTSTPSNIFSSSFLHTLYLGGGTPSQLSSDELNRLVEGLKSHLDLSQLIEFTMEMNPEDVTQDYVQALPPEINRVSMGVQSFVDSELLMLRRRHNAQRPADAIRLLHDHGISNISIDLMYGLPNQTLESFDFSITQALSLHTQHISAYCLSVEEGTELHRKVENGQLQPADDELCNKMNALLRSRLQQAGFVQYEISNYALPGFESRHNSSYWHGTPYLGLGPGAHSYDGLRTRWFNDPDLQSYINGCSEQQYETLTDDELYNEAVMLQLRTREGVNTTALQLQYPSQYKTAFLPSLDQLRQKGWITTHTLANDTHIALTSSGLDMADEVMRQLMI